MRRLYPPCNADMEDVIKDRLEAARQKFHLAKLAYRGEDTSTEKRDNLIMFRMPKITQIAYAVACDNYRRSLKEYLTYMLTGTLPDDIIPEKQNA